jgi:NitT/TauT family transport system ATP-binding protein
VYLGDRVILLGDRPARIVREYPITIDRATRRESPHFVRKVEEVRAGLQAAIQSAAAGGWRNGHQAR